MKKYRILALMHEDLVPPDEIEDYDAPENQAYLTEYDVVEGLRELGHDVKKLGVYNDLSVIRNAIKEYKPHIAFNLLEEFNGVALYDQHVVSYLELLQIPYTGCNPHGLTLCHDKAICKKILSYHRIPTPKFMVVPRGRKVKRIKKLEFPLIVKSLVEEASLGISQASIVHNDAKLEERVRFIHESIRTDALIEQYIAGRELYVAMIGNQRIQPLPIWELWFENLPEGSKPIATQKVKWDENYQEKIGLDTGPVRNMDQNTKTQIEHLCKRAYRALKISGYARFDLRLTPQNQVYILEVNPNPDLASFQEFARAAEHGGLDYLHLLQKILSLGRSYRRL